MLDRAECADFGCHNSIRLETKHFLNTLALTFISFSGRFVFAMQKHYLFFCERSSSFYCFHFAVLYKSINSELNANEINLHTLFCATLVQLMFISFNTFILSSYLNGVLIGWLVD